MKNLYKQKTFEKTMVMNKNKRGQAAIEFLMTYGWMLLVVLIVGALIFSFVDFGSLLPNKLDLTNSFKGDAQRIVASADTDQLQFVVRFVGARANNINLATNKPTFEGVGSGKVCSFVSLTDSEENQRTNTTVSFVNGQESVLTYNCSTDLIKNDVLEGTISIKYSDPRTSTLTLVSSGNVRVSITD